MRKMSSALPRQACILAALLLAGPAAAADRAAQLDVAGTARSYALHVPDRAAPADGFPLVFAFHGGGMQGEGMRRMTRLDAVADERGFIVVYPDGVDKHWNDGRATIRNPQDDVGFVAALIARIARDEKIDRGRIYATGISNGALFAERLGCELSATIAAIAPVAGTLPADIAPDCRPARPLAVLQIDGTLDPIMPFGGGMVADFGGRGEGGQVLAVAATAAFWARANGCGAADAPQPLAPVAPPDRTRIVRTNYGGCPAGAAVTLLTIIGGGHAWPGGPQYARPAVIGKASGQLDASRAIVDFFLAQPRVD